MAVLFVFYDEMELNMIEGYKTIKELALEWDVNPRTIQTMCADGRIQGAVKFGRDWAVPANVKRPSDKRVVSGKYKDWRKKEEIK